MHIADHRARRALLVVSAFLAVVATACVIPPPPPPPPPPGAPTLTVTTILSGLTHPWDLQFMPDGNFVFTERNGKIEALVGASDVRLLAQPADTFISGEGGMLGIAVDPNFSTNRYIYTCMDSTLSGSPDVRVVRWTVDAALTSLTGRTDIITGAPVNALGSPGRHSGCRPRFGPDGYLWVTAGDAATGTNPQDPSSLGGKVLRDRKSVV